MGFKSTDSLKSYRGFGGRTFSSGKGGDSGFPNVKIPPVISSVGLTTTAGANRFTSQDFTVTTTMLNDGPPVSQKSVKATVTADFAVYPTSDTIASKSTSTVSNVSKTLTSINVNELTGSCVFFYYNRTLNSGQWWSHSQSGSSTYINVSNDNGTTWTSSGQESFSGSALNNARVFGDYAILSSSTQDRAGAYKNMEESNSLLSLGYYSGRNAWRYNGNWYSADKTTFYKGSNSGPTSMNTTTNFSTLYEYGHTAAGNNMVVCVARGPASTYYLSSRRVMLDSNGDFTGSSSNGTIVNSNTTPYDLGFYNGYFWCCSNAGVHRSSDGVNWTQVGAVDITYAQRVRESNGYIYISQGNSTVWRTANNGTSWTKIVTGSNGGSTANNFEIGAGHLIHTGHLYSAPRGLFFWETSLEKDTLTLNSNDNLNVFGGINVGDGVRGSGSGVSIVSAINTGTPSITVGGDGTFNTSEVVTGTAPLGSSQESTRYLTIDQSGNVSDIVTSDPGFVSYGPGTEVTLSFPATFSTGNAPDTDLPAGASIRAEIQASSSVATDTSLSNIVTPT